MRRATTPEKTVAPRSVGPAKTAPKKAASKTVASPKVDLPKTATSLTKPIPAKAAPTKAAPVKAAPEKVGPIKVAAVKVAPSKAAPVKVASAKAAPKKKSNDLELFVCRSGPRRGDAQLEAAFRTKPEAVAFLANVHGLATDEQKALSREGKLALNPRVHGSEICAIKAVKMPPPEAARALSGEMFL